MTEHFQSIVYFCMEASIDLIFLVILNRLNDHKRLKWTENDVQ